MNLTNLYQLFRNSLLVVLFVGCMGIPLQAANNNFLQARPLVEVLEEFSQKYEVLFSYDSKALHAIEVNFEFKKNESLDSAIGRLLGPNFKYESFGKKYYVIYQNNKSGKKTYKKVKKHFKKIKKLTDTGHLTIKSKKSDPLEQVISVQHSVEKMKTLLPITGIVLDGDGEALIGVNILVKGTDLGTITDIDGKFTLDIPSGEDILIISYIGYETIEVPVNGRSDISITLSGSVSQLDEVLVIGFGTQKKSDLTGSVVRADIDAFREQPNISLIQSLQGSVPGLNIGQVDAAGESPSISVRGRTSISGQQNPLIILDGTIYRGQLVDINPSDIESVDVLKDASATAVYGSQAANGVILITSKSGTSSEKTTINYTTSYTFQSPINELAPVSPEGYLEQIANADISESYTEASGFTQRNPDYDPTTRFKTGDMIDAFNNGQSTNWFDELTNDNPYVYSQNLSLSHRSDHVSTFASVGLTDQVGYHVGEDYKRWNARFNIDNYVNDWLTIGLQSFFTFSDFSGLDLSRNLRYLQPYALGREENGELTVQPGGNSTNPLRAVEEAQHRDTRLNLFGNIYAKIDFPFLEGLSYKINYTTNYRNENEFLFRPYAQNFQGEGSKSSIFRRSYSSDNILTYDRLFGEKHKVTATLLYGFEKRDGNGTVAGAAVFLNDALGYNQLEAGQSDLQAVATEAYEESSLYSMARLFYSFNGKYLITGTVRRDGFSGFGVENKFGVFPSGSVAWVVSEESFLRDIPAINQLKIRGAYGISGNRTIGRYATLARVSGGFSYVDANGNPLFGQSISSLANPSLQWETTTGLNIGVDFSLFKNRISGSIDFYSNETEDVLYEVNLPQIARFPVIPVNLGKLENSGIDIILSTVNIQKGKWNWTSTFNFSRNRDELVELLGFDNDEDGQEDDIIDAGLFIGEPLNAIFDYEIEGGLYQLTDDIPSGFDVGSFIINDLNGDGEITPDDRKIIGYQDPNFRFSIQNEVTYGNWTLRVFINSVQGGNNFYLAQDNLTSWNAISSENVFDRAVPQGVDYWTPENQDARYQKLFINVADGLQGTRYIARSFVRLQDVSLSYRFPAAWLNRWNISNLKLFVSGKNLATWTDFPGWDPETGVGLVRNGRAVLKGYTFGLDVSF